MDTSVIKKVRGIKMNCMPLILILSLMLLVPQVSPALAAPTGSIMCEILIFSADKKGYDVFQDGVFLGKEGTGSDLPDGNYRLFVTGNMLHTIAVDDGKFTYGMKDLFFTAGVPHSISIDSPEMKLGPAGIYRKPGAPGSSQGAEATRQQGLQNPINPPPHQNQPPDLIALSPSIKSPQQVGTTTIWRAQCRDAEGDPLIYRFLLRGPGTGGRWSVVQDWSPKGEWSWRTGDKDAGSSDVSVLVRDGKHAGPAGLDDFVNATGYVINRRPTNLNVNIANEVYTQKDRRIYYCQEGNMMLIKNRIYLTGPDLSKVQRVKYILHPSFPNPEQVSDNPGNNFEIWIMTWGRFPLTAIITTKDGMTFDKTYDFTFKSKVEEAMGMGIPMVSQCG